MRIAGKGRLYSCYVLHRRDYGNTSLLLELFSRDLGKLPAIAKGVRSRRSDAAGLMQPLRPLLVGISGAGEVRTITACEAAGRPHDLNGTALYCGFYLNELLMHLLGRNDQHENLYEQYEVALSALAEEESKESVLRRFELSLLREIGYGTALDRDAESGEPLKPEQIYIYRPEQGPVPVATRTSAQQVTVRGQTLLDLHQHKPLYGESAREARDLLREVIAFYLGGRQLKSRELFK